MTDSGSDFPPRQRHDSTSLEEAEGDPQRVEAREIKCCAYGSVDTIVAVNEQGSFLVLDQAEHVFHNSVRHAVGSRAVIRSNGTQALLSPPIVLSASRAVCDFPVRFEEILPPGCCGATLISGLPARVGIARGRIAGVRVTIQPLQAIRHDSIGLGEAGDGRVCGHRAF